MTKVVIRVDSSRSIGSGHLMRCLTLARALSLYGACVTFLCRHWSTALIKRISPEFKLVLLERVELSEDGNSGTGLAFSEWLGCSEDRDADDCIRALKLNGFRKIDLLIVDSYGVSKIWEKKMRQYSDIVKMVALDDIANRSHHVDVLIDQNYYGEKTQNRYKGLLNSTCKLMAGPDFAILGNDYKSLHPIAPVRRNAERVLVFFSGTDPKRDTLKAITNLQGEWAQQFSFDVIFTAENKEEQHILEMVSNIHGRIRTHQWVNSLAELILRSDICIGGGGHNTWERACLGLPSLVIPIAENQKEMTLSLSEDGYIKASSFEKIESDMPELIRKMHRMSRECLGLVDGLGSERIIESIM